MPGHRPMSSRIRCAQCAPPARSRLSLLIADQTLMDWIQGPRDARRLGNPRLVGVLSALANDWHCYVGIAIRLQPPRALCCSADGDLRVISV